MDGTILGPCCGDDRVDVLTREGWWCELVRTPECRGAHLRLGRCGLWFAGVFDDLFEGGHRVKGRARVRLWRSRRRQRHYDQALSFYGTKLLMAGTVATRTTFFGVHPHSLPPKQIRGKFQCYRPRPRAIIVFRFCKPDFPLPQLACANAVLPQDGRIAIVFQNLLQM
jgi:hypothetical protein